MIDDLAKLIVKIQELYTPSQLKRRYVNRSFDETFHLIGTGLNPLLKNGEYHEAVWIGYLAATSNPLLWKLLAL